ncbi:hypothetical protein N7492_003204 [Penicillium capsulatum]|uniref:Uncharacterized protein n=1 Tax=Penicillium capsulatum TaxID=69766 RepID=A0A9W9LWQ9_9EURO|nr:hypothetical protein N7492_003204 [Penicillium capsulatum]KAJ6122209.1 hypothetical protein N7512_004674 [Penicillium capsulatum]
MSFLFGRRRSQSDVVSARHADDDTRSSRTPHTPPSSHGDENDVPRFFHGLLRRRSSDGLVNSGSTKQTQKPSRGSRPRIETNDIPHPGRSRDRGSRGSRDLTPSTPGSPEPSSAAAHGEPKQPGNIQDVLDSRLDEATKPVIQPNNGSALTKKDVKAILSGAPHFLLERGKHGRWYPQVIFPWDDHNPSIQRMLDRKPLPHASFTLCTLHAHLPVPDDWAVMGGVPIPLQDWRRTGAPKRSTFDVGVFEVPNMLANNGKEPGTIGYRHFLELSIADALRYTGPEQPRQALSQRQISSLPATEAFELMDHYDKPYSQCQSGAVFDRRPLIREGPAAWKRIGVRDVNLRTLSQRLDHLRQIRLGFLQDGSTMTILDVESPHELHNILHTHFLFPHPPPADVMPGHPQSIKSQIKTLTTVLSTPGAWINFSLPEWRFRAGQILWEALPRWDGESPDPTDNAGASQQKPWINSGMERKWLLVQLLLAAELIFRLDAFVRVDMLNDPHGGQITIHELHDFDRLRDGKVNWDLITVRRFLDNLDITCDESPRSPPERKPRRVSFFESLSRRLASNSEADDLQFAWQCQIGSPHIGKQLEGLYVFAENIGWPGMSTLKSALEQKLKKGSGFVLPSLVPRGARVSENSSLEPIAAPLVKGDMYSRSRSRRCVKLRSFDPRDKDPHAHEVLGWISRSLLSGFVIPGEAICHLLIGTLLENDPDAVKQLGPTANLYGGFVYKERSWWSKACIVGRVLSCLEAQTCMGWVGSSMIPWNTTTGESLGPGWFEIPVQSVACSRKPRIKQGGKLAMESTPLGMGEITAESFTLPVDPATGPASTVDVQALKLSIAAQNQRGISVAEEASLSFSLEAGPSTIFSLTYDVRFISAHECRRPRGVVFHSTDDSAPNNQNRRLPGHPLHRSFPYRHVTLESLPDQPAPQTVSRAPRQALEILVIDARGCRGRETFARAWSASVGCHALIGRSGRTCVGCCVREARALDIAAVIRVGD